MINRIKNIYSRLVYGKIVYKSANGTTIRKKTSIDSISSIINTKRTVFDKNGNIKNKIERQAYVGENTINSSIENALYYNNEAISRLNKNYRIDSSQKKLTDYTNQYIDYSNAILRDNNKETLPHLKIWYKRTIIDKNSGKIESTYDGNYDVKYITHQKK